MVEKISFDQRIADKVIEKLPIEDLNKQLSTMNDLLSQLVDHNRLLMESITNFQLDNRSQREQITKELDDISTRFIIALSNVGLSPDNPGLCKAQVVTVATAGTAVQLPDVFIPKGCSVTIKALSTNTGIIWIADSKFEAEAHTLAYPLTKDDDCEYTINNLSLLWVDATVGGDKIAWKVEQDEKQRA